MAMIKKVYELEDLECANCAAKMQDAINKMEDVQNCNINFLTQKMSLELEESKEKEIIKKVAKCIKKIEPDCTIVL